MNWYYFGARYYDAELGRWLSVDPAAGKYPGVSPYCYAGNNPILLYDPNGLEWKNAMYYAKRNLINLSYGIGISGYGQGGNWQVVNSNVATCNEVIARAYRGDADYPGFSDFPVEMGEQVNWFKSRGDFTTNRQAGEIGDVIFFGDVYKPGKRHAVIIVDVKDGKYKILGARRTGKPSMEYPNYYSIEKFEKEWFKKSFYGIGSIQQRGASKFDIDWFLKYDASISAPPDNTRTYFRRTFSSP